MQLATVPDPAVKSKVTGISVVRRVHSAASGYQCEGEIRGRYERIM